MTPKKYYCCHAAVDVQYLFLAVPWVGLWSVIVALLGHTHLLFDDEFQCVPENQTNNNLSTVSILAAKGFYLSSEYVNAGYR